MDLEVSPFPPGREHAGIRGISVRSSPVAVLGALLVNACKSLMLAQWTQEQTVPTNGLQQALTCRSSEPHSDVGPGPCDRVLGTSDDSGGGLPAQWGEGAAWAALADPVLAGAMGCASSSEPSLSFSERMRDGGRELEPAAWRASLSWKQHPIGTETTGLTAQATGGCSPGSRPVHSFQTSFGAFSIEVKRSLSFLLFSPPSPDFQGRLLGGRGQGPPHLPSS